MMKSSFAERSPCIGAWSPDGPGEKVSIRYRGNSLDGRWEPFGHKATTLHRMEYKKWHSWWTHRQNHNVVFAASIRIPRARIWDASRCISRSSLSKQHKKVVTMQSQTLIVRCGSSPRNRSRRTKRPKHVCILLKMRPSGVLLSSIVLLH